MAIQPMRHTGNSAVSSLAPSGHGGHNQSGPP
jgi:hypothetical protein